MTELRAADRADAPPPDVDSIPGINKEEKKKKKMMVMTTIMKNRGMSCCSAYAPPTFFLFFLFPFLLLTLCEVEKHVLNAAVEFG